jgi:Protein of unknown function (DUF3019)
MHSGGRIAFCLALCALGSAVRAQPVELQVRPRVCTLSAKDEHCNTTVVAEWRSPRNESLCLHIVGRPEIRRCWEDHSAGRYTVSLVFSEDLQIELRDTGSSAVLASQAIRVIREALELRRKRRPPWSVF